MRAGEVIASRFELVESVGVGGMGRVFRALDRESGATVAVKLLRPSDDVTGARFTRVASRVSAVDHPRIVSYVAHGAGPDGVHYLAMEWLEGESLSERLMRGTLSVEDALALGVGAADALAVAHAHGVIHRDIKPSNLFLVDGDPRKVKVLDLGIARLVEGGRQITRTGALLGTPSYMAPEQVRGVELDARVDVYALGCVLFECLAGRPAFRGADMMAIFCKILLEEQPSLSDAGVRIPPVVEDLVQQMLDRDPEQRPKDGSRVAVAIRSLRAQDARDPGARSTGAGITEGEREIRSVILVAGALDDTIDVEAPTVAGATDAGLEEEVAAAAKQFEARSERIANGAIVVTLAGRGTATDLAERAAGCALAIHGVAPRNYMAMATGRAEVRGRQRVGEVFDRAARLLRAAIEAQAAPCVHVDDVTVGLVGRRFEIGGDEQGLILEREREIHEPVRTLLGKPSKFVGRDRELLTLESIYAECQNELVAHAVVVTGEPGSGKSRLRYELQRRLLGRGEQVEIWLGRAEPLSAGSALSVLGNAIRRVAGIRDGEAAVLQRGRLRARIGRHLDDDVAGTVTPFIGELAGVPFPDDELPELRAARENPISMAQQLKRAWREWLSVECVAQPFVLILEDFQWGDATTAQFVDHTLAEMAEVPVMVLVLARPELDELFPRLWIGRRTTTMRLAELSTRASERLAREVLGSSADAQVVRRVVELAGGNPFYLEELLRAVVEGRSELPQTVLAMVQSRLAELPAATRRVLRAASVFGTTFWKGGVAAVTGGGQQAVGLDGLLQSLVEDEIISPRSDAKFPAESEYAFRHGLLREASYESLTASDRRIAHKLAAVWLERVGESDPQALAEHFERSDQPARAAEMLLASGWRLLGEGVPEAALESFRRADALGVPGAEMPRLARGMWQAHRLTNRHQALVEWVDGKLSASVGPHARAALLEARICALRSLDTAAAIELADEALRACAAVGDMERYASVLSQASFAAYRRSDVESAVRFAGLARERSFGSARAEFHALRAQLFAAVVSDDNEGALAISMNVRERALAVGDMAAAANESNNVAESLLDLGFPQRAAVAADEAVEYGRRSGHRIVEEYAQVLRACADAEMGNLDRAIERHVALAHRLNTMFLIDSARYGGHYLLERGKPGDAEQAVRILSLALDGAHATGVHLSTAGLMAVQARAYARMGDRAAAEEQFSAALQGEERVDDFSVFQIALACIELQRPNRDSRIQAARERLLANADRRTDRTAYLNNILLHRRILLASGGMPE